MPYRQDIFALGQYYHIYNRGAGKERLFYSPNNYEYLLKLIKQYHERYGIAIIAYCLMPNHYHFLLRQDAEEPLSKFVNVLFNAYVQALNRQQERSGTLFQGRFRHVWIDREEYLVHLCRYIHWNPVKAKLVVAPEEWPYSNYLEWIQMRQGSLKDEEFIRERFPSPESYRLFVHDDENQNLMHKLIGKYIWD